MGIPSSGPRTCPQCGASVPGGAPSWLCPKCLLGSAVSPPPQPDLSQTPHEPAADHIFGDYELLEEIARGGMGVIYKARQISLNRIVAVKMLPFGRLANPETKQRFRAEAQAAASLRHPNIVAVHEVGEQGGQQYFSMDYVEGPDPAHLVGDNPLPFRRAVVYLKTIAEAIHFAHERGILHRDLKPSNVLIDATDQPRITDFGVAKRLSDYNEVSQSGTQLTLSGQILGTPQYMPPEQADGRRTKVGPASDVYSLGAVLYYLLTGRPPVQAGNIEYAVVQLLHRHPDSPSLFNPKIPQDLETVCLKCLEKESTHRYCTAQALAEDLGKFLRDEPIQARPVGIFERFCRWVRRKPAAASLIVALLIAGAALWGVLWQWRRAEEIGRRLAVFQPPTRTLASAKNLIDLRSFYNGGPGEEFEPGIRRFAGTDFKAEGWIHLDASRADPSNTNWPRRVDGIPIERRCRRLYFLHTGVWLGRVRPERDGIIEELPDVPFGAAVGYYVLHYSDGMNTVVPIIHGRDIRDFSYLPGASPDGPDLTVAWVGHSENSRRHGGKARLYKSMWENPRPRVRIRSLDFVQGETHGVPILLAITAEP